jgi:predicted nucleic-acid-binding protein
VIALDTNILARLVTNDDPVQARQAALLIDAGGALFVPMSVILELEWVLRGAYALDKSAVTRSFEALLSIKNMTFERAADVQHAIELYLHGFDFADALHHCGAKGCTVFATFDDKFRKLAVKSNLMPQVISPNIINIAPKEAK